MVEQRTENPRVVGSIPTLGTPKSEETLDIRNAIVYNTMRARVVEWYYASLPRRSSRVRSPSRALSIKKEEHPSRVLFLFGTSSPNPGSKFDHRQPLGRLPAIPVPTGHRAASRAPALPPAFRRLPAFKGSIIGSRWDGCPQYRCPPGTVRRLALSAHPVLT